MLRLGLLSVLVCLAWARPAHAQFNCSAWVGPTMLFGTINLLDGGVADTSAPITYGCYSGSATAALLCISIQPDQATLSYDPRYLATTNGDRLAFNLYKDAARAQIAGSIDSGTYTPLVIVQPMAPNEYRTWDVTIYGRIKAAGQEGLPTGWYNSNTIGGWPMKLSYKEYKEGMPLDCNTGMTVTPISTFYIEAIIQNECRIQAASTMNFGNQGTLLSGNVDTTSTITVFCNGTPYRVRLDNGLHASGNTRRMQGASGFIQYDLYREPARQPADRWGYDNGTDKTGTGNGQSQDFTVYGRVPPQTAPGPGLYSDTITVTVTY